jgi:O-acetyl-ADP-ribose deacetylase (regulator of RNase III)
MIKYRKGNLLNIFDAGDVQMIAHGCNCFTTMGAGIARQIKDRYPDAYYADRYCTMTSLEKLGNFSSNIDDTVFNLYTQYHLGPNASLDAIKMAFYKLNTYFIEEYTRNHGFILGIPLIGCGIGGLAWDDVEPIIKKQITEVDILVVNYET